MRGETNYVKGDITNMRQEDLDKRTLFALQIEKLINEKNKTDDPQQINLMLQRLSQLKEYEGEGRVSRGECRAEKLTCSYRQIVHGRPQMTISDMVLESSQRVLRFFFSFLLSLP